MVEEEVNRSLFQSFEFWGFYYKGPFHSIHETKKCKLSLLFFSAPRFFLEKLSISPDGSPLVFFSFDPFLRFFLQTQYLTVKGPLFQKLLKLLNY